MVSIDLNSRPSWVQEVPAVCSIQEGLSVQGHLFRSVDSATGLHKGHGSSLVVPSLSRCSHFALSGRLADPRLVVFGGSLGKGRRTRSLSSTRHCDK